ncbi:MAG TPA: cupin domain-containing protein [Aestuariivirgaceae bacterium]|nr:cupin domain-containing protein [Aestuariivirgaceae bacterium]
MAEKITVLRTEGKGAPAPEVDRATTTWNHWTGDDGRLLCGIWESEPGKSDVAYTEWEFCHLIAGKAVLTNEAGESWTLEAGDGFIIPPGFKGTWETVEKVRKHYVILLPKS